MALTLHLALQERVKIDKLLPPSGCDFAPERQAERFKFCPNRKSRALSSSLLLPSLLFTQPKKRKQNAGRRMFFNEAASTDAAAAPAGAARLPAFHRGTCGSDQPPPLSSSHALPGAGLGRDGCYPPPAALRCSGCNPAGRSSCWPGVFARSRPGAGLTRPRPREPHSLRRPESPAGVPHGKRDDRAGNHIKDECQGAVSR